MDPASNIGKLFYLSIAFGGVLSSLLLIGLFLVIRHFA